MKAARAATTVGAAFEMKWKCPADPFFISLAALTHQGASAYIARVKWLALFALLLLETSCTTLANRRDLYSPQPDPDLDWHRQIPTTSHAAEETVPTAAIR